MISKTHTHSSHNSHPLAPDLGGLDAYALAHSPIHRLDPRAKLLVALACILSSISFPKYALSALIPLFIYPVALAALAGLPWRPILLRILIAAPFAVAVGALNPLLDRAIILHAGPIAISGGWISFLSLLARFFLAVSAALILVATTGMTAVCAGLTRLGVPRAFVVQLLLLYRYLFVLGGEASRMKRAYTLRSGGARVSWRVFGSLAGGLLLRALDRAQRLHVAMLCRGFRGEFPLARPLRFRPADWAWLLGWIAFFILARRYNLPRLLGHTLAGGPA